MLPLSITELIDSIDGLNSTLQSTPTDWAQVIANTFGVIVAAGIAIMVSSQQHRRQVVHEVRREVAYLVAETNKLHLPTRFFESLAEEGLAITDRGVASLDRMISNFEKHLEVATRSRENLNERCEVLYLMGPQRLQVHVQHVQTGIMEHTLEIHRIANMVKMLVNGSAPDVNFENNLQSTHIELLNSLTAITTQAILLGLNPLQRAKMRLKLKKPAATRSS